MIAGCQCLVQLLHGHCQAVRRQCAHSTLSQAPVTRLQHSPHNDLVRYKYALFLKASALPYHTTEFKETSHSKRILQHQDTNESSQQARHDQTISHSQDPVIHTHHKHNSDSGNGNSHGIGYSDVFFLRPQYASISAPGTWRGHGI